MSLDRIIRPYNAPDIFPAKSKSYISSSTPITTLTKVYGQKGGALKTLTVKYTVTSSTYDVKTPTEKTY